MATDVRVPTTGNAGEDAVVLEWNVTEGADVSAGDVLVTLETAKATVEVEAPISGQVLRTFHVAADAEDMGTTSPAYPTPAVIATQPARSAEPDGRAQTPARRHSASPRARKL